MFKKGSHDKNKGSVITRVVIWVIACACASGLLEVVSPVGVEGATVELKFATYVPPGKGSISEVIQWFADEVEKASKNELKIKVFWGESLAKIMEIPFAVQSGAADMGSVVGFYHPELFPYAFGASLNALVLAGAERGGWIEPYKKLAKEYPEVQGVFERRNQKLLAFWEYDKVGVLSTKPITNFSSAKGMKIRTSGSVLPKIYAAAGMIPVTIPSTEAYTAASRGMVDAIMVTPDQAVRERWYEPCKYYTQPKIFGTSLVYLISINNNTWNKISKDGQKAIMEVGDRLTAKYPKSLEDVAQEFEGEFKKVGGTVTEFSIEDQAIWKLKVAKPIFEDYVTNIEKKGIPKVREIVGRLATLMGYQF